MPSTLLDKALEHVLAPSGSVEIFLTPSSSTVATCDQSGPLDILALNVDQPA